MEGQGKRVYINPNFHNTIVKPATTMHVNPAFSQHVLQRTAPQKPKIFINPNFVPPTRHSNQYVAQTLSIQGELFAVSDECDPLQVHRARLGVPSSDHSDSVSSCSTGAIELEPESSIQPAISKSRYSLVRHEQKKTRDTENMERPKATINISRYKTVRVNDVKKNLDNLPLLKMPTERPNKVKQIVPIKTNKFTFVKEDTKSPTPNLKLKITTFRNVGNKYKLVSQNSSSKRDMSFGSLKNVNRKTPIKTKKVPIHVIRSKYKYTRTEANKLKKNNIPCPLFRKYGRCLRKEHGTCDFLHDKKHISICRKFLKGLCFEQSCLLSHDLSSQKMPTCYFYLKGACGKENCPYLHVKLNENTTICSEFLKGYCEKGSNCSKRHVNTCPDTASKDLSSRKPHPCPHKNIGQSKRATSKRKVASTKEKVSVAEEKNSTEANDSRYYKEGLETSDACVNIKPTRCKIGKLPSFIKL